MLFKIINSNADYIDPQNDTDGLNYWVTANHLTFSSSKCKYMIISRKKNPSHPPALKLGSSAPDSLLIIIDTLVSSWHQAYAGQNT